MLHNRRPAKPKKVPFWWQFLVQANIYARFSLQRPLVMMWGVGRSSFCALGWNTRAYFAPKYTFLAQIAQIYLKPSVYSCCCFWLHKHLGTTCHSLSYLKILSKCFFFWGGGELTKIKFVLYFLYFCRGKRMSWFLWGRMPL